MTARGEYAKTCFVLPWLQAFRQRHPGVELRLQLSDRLAGLHREQVDVALRYGEPPDSSLIALPLARGNRRVLCAAPSYLHARGRPSTPQALADHACLTFMLGERTHDRWTFVRGKERVAITVHAAVQCDDGDAVHRLALLGEGIACKSALDIAEDLQRGTLVALCDDWLGEAAPLYLACPDRGQLRPAVRLLHEFLVERIEALQAGQPAAARA